MAKGFTKLTRPAMRKLAPGENLTEHGIVFERLANGDGRFSVNIMVDGERIHRVVGRESDGTTRTQAEDFITQARIDAKHNRLALPKGRKVALPLRKAASKYLERLEEEGGNDLKAKRKRLELRLVPFFGDRPLSKITTFDIERYKKHRLQEKSLRGGDRMSKAAKKEGSKASPKAKQSAPRAGPRRLDRDWELISGVFWHSILDREGAEDDPKKAT